MLQNSWVFPASADGGAGAPNPENTDGGVEGVTTQQDAVDAAIAALGIG